MTSRALRQSLLLLATSTAGLAINVTPLLWMACDPSLSSCRPPNTIDPVLSRDDPSLARARTLEATLRSSMASDRSLTLDRAVTREDDGLLRTARKHSALGALLSRTLPSYSGTHAVGVCDIEVPVEERTFGSFTHHGIPLDGAKKMGLVLQTVLLTLYYPAEQGTGNAGKVLWFPNFTQTIDGFLKMASRTPNFWYRALAYPIAAAACLGTTFPAEEQAQLKVPPMAGTPWPVVLFSHGVGCSRLMYSGFCGELASRGFIVAALEHRDGTGPTSTIRMPDGSIRCLDFVDHKDLDWPELQEQPMNDTALRHVQLQVRVAEVVETISVLSEINNGAPIDVVANRAPGWDWERWKNNIRLDNIVMSGHSLGASAALAAAADPRVSLGKIILMDTAAQRLEPWKGKITCPTMSINSEEWSTNEDFYRYLNICKTINNKMTLFISGTTHPSFSDVHLILPGFINRKIGQICDPQVSLWHTVSTVTDFIKGQVGKIEKGSEKMKRGEELQKPLNLLPGVILRWCHDDDDVVLMKQGEVSKTDSSTSSTVSTK